MASRALPAQDDPAVVFQLLEGERRPGSRDVICLLGKDAREHSAPARANAGLERLGKADEWPGEHIREQQVIAGVPIERRTHFEAAPHAIGLGVRLGCNEGLWVVVDANGAARPQCKGRNREHAGATAKIKNVRIKRRIVRQRREAPARGGMPAGAERKTGRQANECRARRWGRLIAIRAQAQDITKIQRNGVLTPSVGPVAVADRHEAPVRQRHAAAGAPRIRRGFEQITGIRVCRKQPGHDNLAPQWRVAGCRFEQGLIACISERYGDGPKRFEERLETRHHRRRRLDLGAHPALAIHHEGAQASARASTTARKASA